MVYTDGIHMIADTLDELHSFAQRIGLNKCWYHRSLKHPHYDLMKAPLSRHEMYKQALKCGAKNLSSKSLVTIADYLKNGTFAT